MLRRASTTTLGRAGFNCDCPWCSPRSQRWRLGWNLRKNYFHCWSCGSVKKVPTLIEMTGLPYKHLRELISDLSDESRLIESPAMERGNYLPPPGRRSPLLKAHRRYLRYRRYDVDEITRLWSLEAIGPMGGRFAWRVFIPVIHQKTPVSWTTRTIDDELEPRYKSAEASQEAVPHKHLLYGEDYARNAVIVVEGPADVWRIGPGALATFGSAYSRQQLARLANYPLRVICFDQNDPQAQANARRLCTQLEVFPGVTYHCRLESGTDPGNADEGEIEELRQQFLR